MRRLCGRLPGQLAKGTVLDGKSNVAERPPNRRKNPTPDAKCRPRRPGRIVSRGDDLRLNIVGPRRVPGNRRLRTRRNPQTQGLGDQFDDVEPSWTIKFGTCDARPNERRQATKSLALSCNLDSCRRMSTAGDFRLSSPPAGALGRSLTVRKLGIAKLKMLVERVADEVC
jgi:hypothetical protein